ncbi:gamma-aminobutyric acid receptor subunit beta-1 [Caerostris darwini]|uniref:Gamma-aminobutyric acid receptor subunit beta-1 n=1 Tax=Caerostris darwini TaxID=1538125 RepID=A0AAV4Q7Q0_9ARAC|nr:gamma-aminobutyric acid receptor subunit beta-1 [Caerostris darwini]
MLFTLKAASLFVNIILFQNVALSSGSCCRDESEDESCLDLIPVGYKKHLAPPGLEGQPLNLTFAITIIDIDEINTGTMDFRIHGYIFNNWIDDRLLVTNTEIVNAKCSHYIWVPDMVFETAKSAQQFGNRFLYIDKDNNVTLAERYAFKVGCLMNFENYPFDTQVCQFSITLMSSTDKEVNPQWNDLNGNEPISFFKNIEPLQFHLGKPTTYTMKIGYNGVNEDKIRQSKTMSFTSYSTQSRELSVEREAESDSETVYAASRPGLSLQSTGRRSTQTAQLHLPVHEHPPDASADGEHHQHLPPIHPHRGRELGDILAASGSSPGKGGTDRDFAPHALHAGTTEQVFTPATQLHNSRRYLAVRMYSNDLQFFD